MRHLVQLYAESLDAWGSIGWPDGAPLLDQPVKLTRAFAVIRREMARYERKP